MPIGRWEMLAKHGIVEGFNLPVLPGYVVAVDPDAVIAAICDAFAAPAASSERERWETCNCPSAPFDDEVVYDRNGSPRCPRCNVALGGDPMTDTERAALVEQDALPVAATPPKPAVDAEREALERAAEIAEVTENMLAQLWSETIELREMIRAQLEPGSERLRSEYEAVNLMHYKIAGRVNSAYAIRALITPPTDREDG